jgi:BlaI family transcriptional regulator, penicillinase repressor
MAGSKRQSVTDAELAVLKVLWERGPLSAKAIAEVVYPNGAESEFAAVHSFLQRLERKGLVARDRSSFVHLFSATASQADILGQELKTLVERLGTGSVAPLIMQLIDRKRLSRKEAAEIRKLLEKYPQ